MAQAFPFSAIVGQEEMKTAILIAAIDPSIGGILVLGDRGTGKSTAVRALAALLPKMKAVQACRYGCDPADTGGACTECTALRSSGHAPKTHLIPVPVVDLPLGATEDRVVGALDLERALSQEGELRPQLLDRFGLSVEVRTPDQLADRVEVVKRRDAFEQDRAAFIAHWHKDDERIRKQITAGRKRLPEVSVSDAVRERISLLCATLGTDGLRGDLTLLRASRALAALDGATAATIEHIRRVAAPALRHRLRRNPLDNAGSSTRVERALADLFPA